MRIQCAVLQGERLVERVDDGIVGEAQRTRTLRKVKECGILLDDGGSKVVAERRRGIEIHKAALH